jgi:hypothetical protein
MIINCFLYRIKAVFWIILLYYCSNQYGILA